MMRASARVMGLLAAIMTVAMATTPTKVMDVNLKRERVFEKGVEPYCQLKCRVEVYQANLVSLTMFWVKDTGESVELLKVTEEAGDGSFSIDGISGSGDLDGITVDKMDTDVCDSSYFLCEAVAETPSSEMERAIATAFPGIQPSDGSGQEDTVSALQRKLADATALLQMFNMSYQNLEEDNAKTKERLDEITEKLDRLADKINTGGSSDATCDCDAIDSNLDLLSERVEKLEQGTDKVEPTTAPITKCYRGMKELTDEPYVTMYLEAIRKQMRCDTQTDEGGWIVIQRRMSTESNFDRSWGEYADGFGDLTGDFWLGNDAITQLTRKASYTLRIDMITTAGEELYAQYREFRVASEDDNYRLSVNGYSGTSGDIENRGMAYHNNQQFSTRESDNDILENLNCAEESKGGWWFNSCGTVEITTSWKDEKGKTTMKYKPGPKTLLLAAAEMKIRLNP